MILIYHKRVQAAPVSRSIVFCDEHSLDRTVDFSVSFEGGQLSNRYPAPFETYQQLRAEGVATIERKPPRSANKDRNDNRRKARAPKLTWAEQQELARLEARIEALEGEKERLQVDINNSGRDYLKLQALAEQLRRVESELEAISDRWLELSEIAEAVKL